MNVYDLNEFTSTNILLYQQENPLLVFYCLLKDNLEDAILVYQIYKWDFIYCTSVPFLKWIKENKIHIELHESSIKELLQNGDKEVLDYIEPKDYVYSILLSPLPFLQYIIHHYTITIDYSSFIKLIHENKKNLYDIFLLLLSVFDIKESIVVDIIYYLCKYNENRLILHLISLYPLILKKYNSYLYLYFFNSITYNNVELTLYFLSIEPRLIKNICMVDLFIKRCTKTLELLYSLNKTLFTNINHNYIFKKIASNPIIDEPFLDWYLSQFKDKVDPLLFEEQIHIFKMNGYVIDPSISDDYFIHACSNNYLHIVKKYNYKYSILEKGFEIAAFLGYLDIVEHLIHFINKNTLYKILHALILVDTPHTSIVQTFYKSISIYPPKLIHYFCKMGMMEANHYKELDEECIQLLSINGHFSIFYDIPPSAYDISNAFIDACETGKGLFIAKWLYYKHTISKNTIQNAFYNSYDIHTLKWLYSIEPIPMTENNNAYFIERCINNELDIVMWLCELYPHYSYSIVNGMIYYSIDLLKIYKKQSIEPWECCICLEKTGDSMSVCSHCFCYSCINRWYKKNNSCPICRDTLEQVYFYK